MENSSLSQVDLLAELQRLDRVRKDRSEALVALEADLAAILSDVVAREAELAAARSALEEAERRRRDLEQRLEDEGARIKDRRMQLNRVRNERELQALRHEIEQGKEQNQLLEEELLRLMESLEALNEAESAAAGALEKAQSSAEDRKVEGETRVAGLRGEVADAEEERQEIARQLDDSLMRRYELIFARRGGLAVVEVRSGICQGCRMSIPPQMFNEMQKSPELRTCPSCHRILFWRPEAMER